MGPGVFEILQPESKKFCKKIEENHTDVFRQDLHIEGSEKKPVTCEFKFTTLPYKDSYVQIKLYTVANKYSVHISGTTICKSTLKSKEETLQALDEMEAAHENIVKNLEDIEKIDLQILQTYEESPFEQDLAYNKMKCDMLKFFVNKPLFKQRHQDDEKKEAFEEEKEEGSEHPLKKSMKECVQEWNAWLQELD